MTTYRTAYRSSTEEEHKIALQSKYVKSMVLMRNWMMNNNEEGKELTEGEDWKILLLRGIPSWHWYMWILKFLEELLQIPILIFVGWDYCHFALPSTPESSSIHLCLLYSTIIFLFPSHLSNLYLMFCLIPICLHKVLFHHPTAHLLLCVHHL